MSALGEYARTLPKHKKAKNRKRVRKDGLTANQVMFVECLLADKQFNATRAAKKAGYCSPAVSACTLLKNPKIARAIGEAIQARVEKVQIDAEMVLKELACVGFLNPQEIEGEDGRVRSLREMPESVARAVSSYRVSYDKEGRPVYEVRFWSKNEALQLIAKHLGMLDERFKVEHKHEINWDDLIRSQMHAPDHVQNKILYLEQEPIPDHVPGSENYTIGELVEVEQ